MTDSSVPERPTAYAVSRDVIRATGGDAEKFLQGQLSQDISSLAPGESAWTLLLKPQGKVDAWLRITRIDVDTYLMDVDAGHGEAALARLNRFKLRTDCELASEEWSTVSIRGAGSGAVEVPLESGAEVVVPAEWPGVEGIDLLGPNVVLPEGLDVGDSDALNALRIRAGVPAMGAELTAEVIPAESGIVERSVSFTKGCFTGQELVARIDSRGGNVPRHLRGFTTDGALGVGAQIEVDGAHVGMVTSVAGGVGLAYVKRAVADFPADATADGYPVQLRALPMI